MVKPACGYRNRCATSCAFPARNTAAMTRIAWRKTWPAKSGAIEGAGRVEAKTHGLPGIRACLAGVVSGDATAPFTPP